VLWLWREEGYLLLLTFVLFMSPSAFGIKQSARLGDDALDTYM